MLGWVDTCIFVLLTSLMSIQKPNEYLVHRSEQFPYNRKIMVRVDVHRIVGNLDYLHKTSSMIKRL